MTSFEATIERLERLRFASDLTFTPTGDALVATVRPASAEPGKGPDTRVWRFALDGSATELTHGPNSDGQAKSAPVGDLLAFTSDRDLKGKASLFLQADTGEPRPLGDVPGSIEDYRWTSDGAAIVALAADRGLNGGATTGAMRLWWGEPEDPEVTNPTDARRRLFRIEVADGSTREVGPADLSVWEFDLAGDNAAVAVASADTSERGWHHARLVRVDFATRAATVLRTPQWQIQGLAADPSGERIAFLEGWSSDRGLVAGEIKIVNVHTGAIGAVANDTMSNITMVRWRDAGSLWFAGWERLGTVYGVVGVGGAVAWKRHEDAILGESGFVAQIAPAPNGATFAAVREAVGEAPEIVHRRSADAPWTRVTHLNDAVVGGFPGYPEVRSIAWKGEGGLALEGMLVLPRERRSGPLPTIVDIHGGPCYAAKHAFNQSGALAYAIAGYAVFLPNYRGNVGWGQAQARLNIGDPAGAEFRDILAGIDHIVAEGIADPNRLGVTGGSYGGYLTAWAVATTNRFKAAIMVAGISNQLSCHYSCEHDFHEFINGGPLADPQNRAVAVDRSAMTHLDQPTTPTLIIHGREDRCTPLGQAQEFYAALREKGVETEMVVYPGEGHGLRQRVHKLDAARRKLAWFDRYLRLGTW